MPWNNFSSYKYRKALKMIVWPWKWRSVYGARSFLQIFADVPLSLPATWRDMLHVESYTDYFLVFHSRVHWTPTNFHTNRRRVTCACNFTYFIWRITILFDAFFEKQKQVFNRDTLYRICLSNVMFFNQF